MLRISPAGSDDRNTAQIHAARPSILTCFVLTLKTPPVRDNVLRRKSDASIIEQTCLEAALVLPLQGSLFQLWRRLG
jgi:hypothetical protein